MHDLVVKNGLVVDGSGEAPREADVAIRAGRIEAVGGDVGAGREEIDARGKIVTPGWVDVHTHYDGQATWDELLTPSCPTETPRRGATRHRPLAGPKRWLLCRSGPCAGLGLNGRARGRSSRKSYAQAQKC